MLHNARCILIVALGVALLLSVVSTQARAELLAYEGFNYSGTAIHGQTGGGSTGFSAAWSDSDGDFAYLSNDSTSLNSNAFPFTPSGSRVSGSNGTATCRADRNISSTFDFSQEGTGYLSVLLRKNAGVDQSSSEYIQIRCAVSSGGNIFSVGMGSGETFYVNFYGDEVSGVSYSRANTYFAVVKFVSHAGSTADEVYLKVYGPDDTVGLEPTTWDLSRTAVNSQVFSKIDLAFGANIAANEGEIDEIRYGEQWADVVPEPGTFSLVAIGLLIGLGLYARRRWK